MPLLCGTVRPAACSLPRVVLQPLPPAPLQYGHGLFGSQGEVKTSYLVDEADNHSYILGAVNWIGMVRGRAAAISRSNSPYWGLGWGMGGHYAFVLGVALHTTRFPFCHHAGRHR
jgi:hypothetical protein